MPEVAHTHTMGACVDGGMRRTSREHPKGSITRVHDTLDAGDMRTTVQGARLVVHTASPARSPAEPLKLRIT